MSIVNHNVVKAHSFARQAEEALENRQWEPAIHLYQQAADLFLLATNDTSDLESIKALQLLSNAQSNKSKALLKHLQHFNTRNTETTVVPLSNERTVASSEVMEEISLSASENYFVGQSPHNFSDQYSYRERTQRQITQEKPMEKKSVDIWGWMERMLELLVLPESFKGSNATPTYGTRDSSLMSSFYFVPAKEEERFNLDGGDRKPNSKKDPEVKELDQRVQELERNMVHLVDENEDLKKKLQHAYSERVQVSKENDVMKRSIMQFRQEFNKKAHILRDISSSVGHLPSLSPSPMEQDYQQQLERTVQQLRSEVLQLQNQVSSLTLKTNRQHHLIEKYEEELQKYQNAQRKFSQFPLERMSSSPPDPLDVTSSQTLLSSSENPAPFEPDENLTGSLILQ
jgi:hypothetical protein